MLMLLTSITIKPGDAPTFASGTGGHIRAEMPFRLAHRRLVQNEGVMRMVTFISF